MSLNRSLRVGTDPRSYNERGSHHFYTLFKDMHMDYLSVPNIYAQGTEFAYIGFDLMHNGTLDTIGSIFTISEERMGMVRFTNALLPTKAAMLMGWL